MRRKIMIGTALAVLVFAGVAYAATNSYTAAFKFSPKGHGSKAHPVPVSLSETLTAKNNTSGSRAAPLVDIKTSVYGLISTAKGFPTCDGNKISTMKSDSFCPAKALVATGPVNALLGGPVLALVGVPCNPFLHVWNGGHGKLWFFFTTKPPKYACGTLKTGDTQAYPGYVSQHGKFLVTDVPLPSYVSTAVAHQHGLYGSLIKEVLTYTTFKVKGKTVSYQASVACKGKTRPYTVSFTAFNGHSNEKSSVSGTAACS